jgi:hypothetical protein
MPRRKVELIDVKEVYEDLAGIEAFKLILFLRSGFDGILVLMRKWFWPQRPRQQGLPALASQDQRRSPRLTVAWISCI